MNRTATIVFGTIWLGASIGGCGFSRDRTEPIQGHERPATGFMTVNGVRLQYLDWGGTGDGMVFVHGLGDSPHIFDDLAPAFTDHFRVVAYARRGHGRSQARGPYDNGTLTDDLRDLLDSLGIARSVLVGWSLGGNEITEFGARYPPRTIAVVYLDSWDNTEPGMRDLNDKWPLGLVPPSNEFRNLDAFRDYARRAWWPTIPWTPAMEAYVADVVHTLPDGTVRFVTTDTIDAEIRATNLYTYSPRWQDVKAPMLAFFAEWNVEGLLPPQASDEDRQNMEDYLRTYFLPAYRVRAERFRSAAPHARVVELKETTHSGIVFQRRDTIVTEMRSFLESVTRSPHRAPTPNTTPQPTSGATATAFRELALAPLAAER